MIDFFLECAIRAPHKNLVGNHIILTLKDPSATSAGGGIAPLSGSFILGAVR